MGEIIAKLKQAEETIEFKLELEKTISSISSRFVGISDIDESINAMLEDIGKLSGASRAYLFLFNEDGATMDNTHEWCAERRQRKPYGEVKNSQKISSLP